MCFATSMFLEDGSGGLLEVGIFSKFTEVITCLFYGLFQVDNRIGVVNANANAPFYLEEFRHFPWAMNIGGFESS